MSETSVAPSWFLLVMLPQHRLHLPRYVSVTGPGGKRVILFAWSACRQPLWDPVRVTGGMSPHRAEWPSSVRYKMQNWDRAGIRSKSVFTIRLSWKQTKQGYLVVRSLAATSVQLLHDERSRLWWDILEKQLAGKGERAVWTREEWGRRKDWACLFS